MKMVLEEMMTKVMRNLIRDSAKSLLNNVVFDYMIEAQFIGLFNNFYIRQEVKHTVKDALDDIAIGEVIEDYLERIIWEAIPIIA